jgi:ABC-2 type transport system ATP-binding protein
LIKIDQLVVRYGDFTAVDGLSLSVRPGELFGFLGPNGAGKSTTMKVLIGVLRPSSGTVEIAGCRIPAQLEKIKPIFGYVPDTENHIEEFTGRQNLELFADLYSVSRHVVDEMLLRLELDEAADVLVRGYSKGMRKKLLLARELLHSPKILYLDEPTANLDSHSTELVRRMLRSLTESGVTVFVTTHNMEEVEEICDRVAILSHGKLIECDTPGSLVARYAEHKVVVRYEKDQQSFRETLNLAEESERTRLAELVQRGNCTGIQSRDVNFDDVFRKLTGQEFT